MMRLKRSESPLPLFATLGTVEEFIGVDMTFGDVKRLSVKDVEKYFVRYQAVLVKRVTVDLTETVIDVGTKATSYVLPIDDVDETAKELKKNDIVTRELSTYTGYLALNAGRFVALATALFIIAKHVKLGKPKEEAAQPQVPEEPLVMAIE